MAGEIQLNSVTLATESGGAIALGGNVIKSALCARSTTVGGTTPYVTLASNKNYIAWGIASASYTFFTSIEVAVNSSGSVTLSNEFDQVGAGSFSSTTNAVRFTAAAGYGDPFMIVIEV